MTKLLRPVIDVLKQFDGLLETLGEFLGFVGLQTFADL